MCVHVCIVCIVCVCACVCACTFDEEGMVATLPQLHHDIEQAGNSSVGATLREKGEVPLENSTVILLLDDSELHLHQGGGGGGGGGQVTVMVTL